MTIIDGMTFAYSCTSALASHSEPNDGIENDIYELSVARILKHHSKTPMARVFIFDVNFFPTRQELNIRDGVKVRYGCVFASEVNEVREVLKARGEY